jgi:hypothetical protein
MAAVTRTVRTGRTEHEIAEIPPAMLDCGHPYTPGQVTVGYGSPDVDRTGHRTRTYRCRRGATTYSRLA